MNSRPQGLSNESDSPTGNTGRAGVRYPRQLNCEDFFSLLMVFGSVLGGPVEAHSCGAPWWLVFLAGLLGFGVGYAMAWLSAKFAYTVLRKERKGAGWVLLEVWSVLTSIACLIGAAALAIVSSGWQADALTKR